VRAVHPLSVHGVALSLAADAPPDEAHLARLAALVERMQPALISEHLAWSTWRGACHPDLLPFARSDAALARVAANSVRTRSVWAAALPSRIPPITSPSMATTGTRSASCGNWRGAPAAACCWMDGIIGGGMLYVLAKSYVVLVHIIADMLLPK